MKIVRASIRWFRRPAVVILHLVVAALANWLAFWLRFDGLVPSWAYVLQMQLLPVLLLVRAGTFVQFRLYQGMWRYTSLWDLCTLGAAAATGTVLFYGVTRFGLGVVAYPRSVYLIDTLLLVVMLGGSRLLPRLYREYMHAGDESRVLVFGAGDAGEAIVRSLNSSPVRGYRPIGFIDDDPAKTGRYIHGVPVLGTRDQISNIMSELSPDVVLIAISNLASSTVRQVVRSLAPYKAAIKVIPNLHRLLDGRIEISQIRNLAVEDLLHRTPVQLHHARVEALLKGKRVMVSGAGGSIGSELCRQVAAAQPAALILFERYENSLFAIHHELAAKGHRNTVHALVGDITDERRVHEVLRLHRPQIVLHAAAHKHVPLMEASPCEAVKNNVGGTRTIASAAHTHHVECFIMISTDKAVNPTSVMGATKRVAELVVQDIARVSSTRFATVRFGNVLGSNGSVVPLFLEQIRNGGPVTVTHPDVQRYFMSIPEAVQLVLQAASLPDTGRVYVLDMGEQIKLTELARDLIRLSGHLPDVDIPIRFVGLRPGEKLYEELVGYDENAELSAIEKIRCVRTPQIFTAEELSARVAMLHHLAIIQDTPGVIEGLRQLVPTFEPTGTHAQYVACSPDPTAYDLPEPELPPTKLGVEL